MIINNDELPIGFTMELAMHQDSFKRFSEMPEDKQRAIVEGARAINSKDEMRIYVSNICKNANSY